MNDKVKEIRLTESEYGRIISEAVVSEEVWSILEQGNSVILIPPKRKTVRLSELPDGTLVETISGSKKFIYQGGVYSYKTADGCYEKEWCPVSGIHSVIESPKQVWECDECPVPDGVVVRVGFRDELYMESEQHEFSVATKIDWTQCNGPSDIIWYQILRLADGYELVKG